MKFDWKLILIMALPMLEAAGHAKVNEDADDTGKDDAIGESMLYAAKLVKALALGTELPKVPASLK